MSKVTQNYRWFIRGIFPAILQPKSKALGKLGGNDVGRAVKPWGCSPCWTRSAGQWPCKARGRGPGHNRCHRSFTSRRRLPPSMATAIPEQLHFSGVVRRASPFRPRIWSSEQGWAPRRPFHRFGDRAISDMNLNPRCWRENSPASLATTDFSCRRGSKCCARSATCSTNAVRAAVHWRLTRHLRPVTADSVRDAVHWRFVGASVRVAGLSLRTVVIVGLRCGRNCGRKCDGDRCKN